MTYKQRQREERNAEILRLAKLGVPTPRISRLTGASTSVIQRLRKEAGLGSSRRASLTEEQKEFAKRLFEDGVSQREVARTVGCTSDQLRRHFPDQAWDVDQKVEFEQTTGLRDRTSPKLGRRTPPRFEVKEL